MKVAHINSVYKYGSTGNIVYNIHETCLKKGLQSKVFYGRKNKMEQVFFSNKLNLVMDASKSIIFDQAGFNSKQVTKNLVNQLREYQPDIIHLHNLHGYYLNLEILINYIKQNKIKTVMTLHDCWTFTGFCVHYDYKKCNKWQKKCEKCNLVNEYPFRFLPLNTTKNYLRKKELFNSIKDLTIVTPSKWLTDQVRLSFLKNHQLKVINNGIDLDKFMIKEYNSQFSLPANKKIILGVASIWDKRKGLIDFVKLCDKLPDDYLGIVIGVNRSQIKAYQSKKLMTISRTNNLEELVFYYQNAYLLFNPTYEDTFPTVNIEALACGLPIITYNTGGSPEIVGNCGKIVNKGCIEEAKEAIEAIQVTESLKNECQKRANELYSLELMCNKYLNIYQER